MDIYFRVAFKPVATIMQAQETIDKARAKRRLIIQKIDELIDELDDLDVE